MHCGEKSLDSHSSTAILIYMNEEKEDICQECGGAELVSIDLDRVKFCICMVERKHQDQADMEIEMNLEEQHK